MPLPPDQQFVSAADAGPGAPFIQIACPNDRAEAMASHIRRAVAALLANDAYSTTFATALNDNKITGNGEPPAAGYTPTVRPIIVKGQGLQIDTTLALPGNTLRTGPMVTSGPAATHRRRVNTSTDLNSSTASFGVSADLWVVDGPLWTPNGIYSIDDAGADDGMTIEIVIYAFGTGPAQSLSFRRPDSSPILSVNGSGSYVNIRVERVAGTWRLLAATTDTATIAVTGA